MGPARRILPATDAGVSDTIGVVLMLAISVAMAGVLYVWVFGLGAPGGDPAAMGLTSAGGISAAGTKTLTVSSVQSDVMWNDLELKVDGVTFTYDAALAGARTFCVATSGTACVPTGTWTAAGTPVKAGHTLYVHDPALAGKELQVIDAEAGALIIRLPLGALVDD